MISDNKFTKLSQLTFHRPCGSKFVLREGWLPSNVFLYFLLLLRPSPHTSLQMLNIFPACSQYLTDFIRTFNIAFQHSKSEINFIDHISIIIYLYIISMPNLTCNITKGPRIYFVACLLSMVQKSLFHFPRILHSLTGLCNLMTLIYSQLFAQCQKYLFSDFSQNCRIMSNKSSLQHNLIFVTQNSYNSV